MSAVAPSPAGSGKGLQLFAPINQIAPAELVPSSPDVPATAPPADNAVYNPAVPAAVGDAEAQETTAWLLINGDPSMPEAYGTVPTQTGADVPWWRKIMGFVGPGVMISVGYMDPGNWSTDIAGGSAFGYDLLFIVLLSSLIAMFLQVLAVRVGFATGRDLAQCCRDVYPKWLVYILWVCMEIAILCCDLAEVIGAAVALKLLFGLPLIGGVWCVSPSHPPTHHQRTRLVLDTPPFSLVPIFQAHECGRDPAALRHGVAFPGPRVLRRPLGPRYRRVLCGPGTPLLFIVLCLAPI